jgi:hypothetical protein
MGESVLFLYRHHSYLNSTLTRKVEIKGRETGNSITAVDIAK